MLERCVFAMPLRFYMAPISLVHLPLIFNVPDKTLISFRARKAGFWFGQGKLLKKGCAPMLMGACSQSHSFTGNIIPHRHERVDSTTTFEGRRHPYWHRRPGRWRSAIQPNTARPGEPTRTGTFHRRTQSLPTANAAHVHICSWAYVNMWPCKVLGTLRLGTLDQMAEIMEGETHGQPRTAQDGD